MKRNTHRVTGRNTHRTTGPSRGETLREVLAVVEERRDGVLPMDAPGVSENFSGELDLLSALMLRWHARLSGQVEQTLTSQPEDLERAIVQAWRRTAEQLPGLRRLMDTYADTPIDAYMDQVLRSAQDREWQHLALAAGAVSSFGPEASEVGQRLRAVADRFEDTPTTTRTQNPLQTRVDTLPSSTPTTVGPALSADQPSLVDRIKAALAA